MYFINVFFIFSIIGHVIENIVYTKVDSGILYGLWTPIYGIGCITIILINNYLNTLHLKKIYKFLLLFIISSVALAIIETLGGYYIEFVFGRIFWNYNNHLFPIGKYTSLKMMIIWGMSSILLIYIVLPIIDRYIKKIPKDLTLVLILLFITDLFYTYSKISLFSFI